MLGGENGWATARLPQEFRVESGVRLTFPTSPAVPVTLPQNGLRSGVQPSYPSMVTLIVVPAGTLNKVVCIHFPVLGSLMKYDTQSGRLLTVACASSCSVMLTVWPEFDSTPAEQSTVG